MITITPQTFQETVLAWLGVATILLGSISGFVSLVLAKYAAIKAESTARQSEANHAVSTDNIARLQDAVQTIALETTPRNIGVGSAPKK